MGIEITWSPVKKSQRFHDGMSSDWEALKEAFGHTDDRKFVVGTSAIPALRGMGTRRNGDEDMHSAPVNE